MFARAENAPKPSSPSARNARLEAHAAEFLGRSGVDDPELKKSREGNFC